MRDVGFGWLISRIRDRCAVGPSAAMSPELVAVNSGALAKLLCGLAMVTLAHALPKSGELLHSETAHRGDAYAMSLVRRSDDRALACRRRGNLFAYYRPLDRCMPLLDSESPCSERGAVLVLNATTLEAQCRLLPCSLSHVLLQDERCHPKSEVCAGRDDMTLILRETGYGTCDCLDGYLFWHPTGRCFRAYTQGPCQPGEHIVLVARQEPNGVSETVQCKTSPCPVGQVFWQGQCVAPNGHGCLDSVHGHLLLNPASLQYQCTLRCPDGLVEVNLDCFSLYSRGPCSYGQYVEPVPGTRYGRCVPNPCETDNSLPWDGRCWIEGEYCDDDDDDDHLEESSTSTLQPHAHHFTVFTGGDLFHGPTPTESSSASPTQEPNEPTLLPFESAASTEELRPTVRRHIDSDAQHQKLSEMLNPAVVAFNRISSQTSQKVTKNTTPMPTRSGDVTAKPIKLISPTVSTISTSHSMPTIATTFIGLAEQTTTEMPFQGSHLPDSTTALHTTPSPALPPDDYYSKPSASSSPTKNRESATDTSLPLHLQYLLGKRPNLHQLGFLGKVVPYRRWHLSPPPPPPKHGLPAAVREELQARHATRPPPPPPSAAGLIDLLGVPALHGQASEPNTNSMPAPMRGPVKYTYDGRRIENPLQPLLERRRRRRRRGARLPQLAPARRHPFSGTFEAEVAVHAQHILVNPQTRQIECSGSVAFSRQVSYAHYKCRLGSRRDLLGECQHAEPTWIDSHPGQCLPGMRLNLLTGECKVLR